MRRQLETRNHFLMVIIRKLCVSARVLAIQFCRSSYRLESLYRVTMKELWLKTNECYQSFFTECWTFQELWIESLPSKDCFKSYENTKRSVLILVPGFLTPFLSTSKVKSVLSARFSHEFKTHNVLLLITEVNSPLYVLMVWCRWISGVNNNEL
jgi:hypothetical protein